MKIFKSLKAENSAENLTIIKFSDTHKHVRARTHKKRLQHENFTLINEIMNLLLLDGGGAPRQQTRPEELHYLNTLAWPCYAHKGKTFYDIIKILDEGKNKV